MISWPIDCDKKKEDVRKKTSDKMDEVNKKLEDTEYWEKKGQDVADKINQFFGGK